MTLQEKTQLNADFLKVFPLDSLQDMTLEQYTNLNRSDSFCYWLESRTTELGSIWGGSAYKFGIFKYDKKPEGDMTNRLYDDQYAWYAKLGSTAEEAFSKVREAISAIALYGRQGNLNAIENIDVLGSIIKWKIAFLYSNETLVPYYSLERLKVIATELGMEDTSKSTIAEIQQFLMEKRAGKNIYEYGDELDNIWVNYTANNNPEDSKKKVWMWAGDMQTFSRERLTAGDSVSGKIRDYSQYEDYQSMKDDYQEVHGNTDVSVPDAYWKFIKHVNVGDIVVVFENIRVGRENHHKMYGWGIFTSNLINDLDSESPLQREVEWKQILEEPITSDIVKNKIFFHKTSEKQAKVLKELLGINSPSTTVCKQATNDLMKYSKYIELLKESQNLVLTGAPGTGKTYMAQAIAEEMGCTKEEMCFVQFHPSYDYTDFVEGLRPVEKEDGQMGFERRDGVFKEFCKKAVKNIVDSQKSVENLTKELSWEDKLQQFVEDAIDNGNKFKLSNGNEFSIAEFNGRTIIVKNEQNEKTNRVTVSADEIIELLTNDVPLNIVRDIRNYFNRKFGTQPDSYAFIITKAVRAMKDKTSVVEASKVNQKPFVFVIDEINRGEASKIFGELFYAIDPGYRGKKDIRVKTQYQNLVQDTDVFAEGFYVPENVYILATMNDIDRSVESMDFAMRRRFTWQEVTPADTQSMLDTLSCAEEAKSRMNSLNKTIAETDGLGAAYMVGPSYFLKLKTNGGDFRKLWEMNIEPLLKEYLRGFRKVNETMERLKSAYYQENVDEVDVPDLVDDEN